MYAIYSFHFISWVSNVISGCMQNLEQLLDSYLGCVLVVSHDKAFMTNVVDSMFVLEGDGLVRKFNGKYEEYLDYMEQRQQVKLQVEEAEKTAAARNPKSSNGTQHRSRDAGSRKVQSLHAQSK